MMRSRRWWRGWASPRPWGVATALVILGTVPIGCSTHSRPTPEDRSLAEVRRWGGRYERDDRAEGHPVVRLDLTGRPVTDADLVTLEPLVRLNSLSLRGTRITDAGVSSLKTTGKLRHLDLGESTITDAGLGGIGELSSLRGLSLDATRVTDAGLERLSPLSKLSVLSLRRTAITDAGLVHLRGLTSLRILNLEGTRVTNAGMARLRRESPQVRVVAGRQGELVGRTF